MDRIEQLEDLAYNKQPCPHDVSNAELLLYLSFSALYAYAQHGSLSREQGQHLKQQIIERHNEMSQKERLYNKAQFACSTIDILVKELRKIPDLEQRPILADFVITMTGGDSDGEKEQ